MRIVSTAEKHPVAQRGELLVKFECIADNTSTVRKVA